MKKLTTKISLLLLMLCASKAHAFNPLLDIRDNIQFHKLDNIHVATFFDSKRGELNAGILSEIVDYRPLALLAGYQKLDVKSGIQRYEPVLSIGLRLAYFAPGYRKMVGDQSPLLGRLDAGPYVGYSFSDKIMIYGLAVTAKFDIPKP